VRSIDAINMSAIYPALIRNIWKQDFPTITQEFVVKQKFFDILFHAPMTNQYLFISQFDTARRERELKILLRRTSADATYLPRWKKKCNEKRGNAERVQPASGGHRRLWNEAVAARGMGDAVGNRQAVS